MDPTASAGPHCALPKKEALVRDDPIPDQDPVHEIGFEHTVLPPVLVGDNRSIALLVEGLPRNSLDLVEAHSLSNSCRSSSLPLPNVDSHTVEVIDLDRSRARGSPIHVRGHLPISGG